MQGLANLGTKTLTATDTLAAYQLPVQPRGADCPGLLFNGQVGFQGHGNATSTLPVILATLLGQVSGYPPDILAQALHNASPAQGFQPTTMGGHNILGFTTVHSLTLLNPSGIQTVQPLLGQCGNIAIHGAGFAHTRGFHHGTCWVFRQFRPGRQRQVVGLAVEAIEYQVATVVQLISQPLGGNAADDGAGAFARLENSQLPLLATHGALHCADDVAPLAHGAQGLLRAGLKFPGAGLLFRGQPQALQMLQAADQQ